MFEYDSTVTGVKRKAVVYLPPNYSSDKNIPCSICSTALAATNGNGAAMSTAMRWWIISLCRKSDANDHRDAERARAPRMTAMPPPDKTFSPENAAGFWEVRAICSTA